MDAEGHGRGKGGEGDECSIVAVLDRFIAIINETIVRTLWSVPK